MLRSLGKETDEREGGKESGRQRDEDPVPSQRTTLAPAQGTRCVSIHHAPAPDDPSQKPFNAAAAPATDFPETFKTPSIQGELVTTTATINDIPETGGHGKYMQLGKRRHNEERTEHARLIRERIHLVPRKAMASTDERRPTALKI